MSEEKATNEQVRAVSIAHQVLKGIRYECPKMGVDPESWIIGLLGELMAVTVMQNGPSDEDIEAAVEGIISAFRELHKTVMADANDMDAVTNPRIDEVTVQLVPLRSQSGEVQKGFVKFVEPFDREIDALLKRTVGKRES